MNPEEDFVHPLLGGVLEIVNEREQQLMVHITEDERSYSLKLIGCSFEPSLPKQHHFVPVEMRDSVIIALYIFAVWHLEARDHREGDDEDAEDDG